MNPAPRDGFDDDEPAPWDDPQPPPGYRWWRIGDDDHPAPVLRPAARYGLVGEFLDVIEPQTEASAAVVGGILLVELGTLMGRDAVVEIGFHRHHPNLFEVIVGETSVGAKGTGQIAADVLMHYVEPAFAVNHAIGGFGSGEAIVDLLRDRDDEPVEKRRLIHEPEFSALLRVGRRENSILSEIIRKGFDHQPIQHRTKTGGHVVATGHHLAVLGSTTPAELISLSTELDIANGWFNRFLLIHARMTQLLPFGGHVPPAALTPIATELSKNLNRLRDRKGHAYRIGPGTDAGDLWKDWYQRVRAGTGNTAFMRALTGRQHAHGARIALLQAVANGADEIGVDHLGSAIAWTDYSVGTAAMLFAKRASGDAGKLLEAIRAAGPAGLAARDQHAVFGRHLSAGALEQLRRLLIDDRQIATYSLATAGRPKDIAIAMTPCERTN